MITFFLDCNKGNIINAAINYESIIKGNIFKNVNIEQQANTDDENYVFLIINEECLPINFDNNSFINISTYYGGFGGSINSFSDSSFEINFVDCRFLNNTQNVNGGAIQTTKNFNDGNISLTFQNCLFENNVANGNGGALCIWTQHDVVIECCSFISNNATNAKGGAIFISNQENSTSKFQLIKNCTFISNIAIDGFAIYIEGYNYEARIDITGNNFTNNYNLETSGCIINIETCIISQKKIEIENLYSNQVNGDDYFGVIVYSCQDPEEPSSEDSSIEIIQSSNEVSDDLFLSYSSSLNEISSESDSEKSVSLSDVLSNIGISSSSDGYFTSIEESDSSLLNQEQTESETASSITNSLGENDNGITDRNGGGISKGTLIGIICGVAAVVLVAVVATVLVFMRKKKMNGLNVKESQSSILEDTETKLQKDKSTTIKDDEDSDLNFWL